MSHDDILKEAMNEIKKILKNADIAGTIILTSKTHVEFLYEFPKWSAIQWNEGGDSVRVRSKKRDFSSKKEQEKILTESVHVIAQNRDMAVQSFQFFQGIFKKLEVHIEIKHEPFRGFEPHLPPLKK